MRLWKCTRTHHMELREQGKSQHMQQASRHDRRSQGRRTSPQVLRHLEAVCKIIETCQAASQSLPSDRSRIRQHIALIKYIGVPPESTKPQWRRLPKKKRNYTKWRTKCSTMTTRMVMRKTTRLNLPKPTLQWEGMIPSSRKEHSLLASTMWMSSIYRQTQ